MTEFTLRQRLALVIEANTTAEKIAAMADGNINHAFFLEHGISPTLLRAAQITPLQLKAHGTRTVAQLADLGFNTLHMMDDEWCDDAIAAYGAPALLDQFLQTTNDAVILAGTGRCGAAWGEPGPPAPHVRRAARPCARGALRSTKNARNVPPKTLIETGLRGARPGAHWVYRGADPPGHAGNGRAVECARLLKVSHQQQPRKPSKHTPPEEYDL